MEGESYHTTIRADITPEEAVARISQVDRWWSTNHEGRADNVGDVFTVRFGSGDRYTIRIAELEPGERVVWDVTDSFQGWVADPSEWVGTRIAWTIKKEANGVSIDMTHVGLAPNLECFDRCKQGWDYLAQESLFRYLTEGKGRPV